MESQSRRKAHLTRMLVAVVGLLLNFPGILWGCENEVPKKGDTSSRMTRSTELRFIGANRPDDSESIESELLPPAPGTYRGIYPGIDLKIRTHGNRVTTLEFLITPGFDIGAIAFKFSHGEISVEESGEILLPAADNWVRLSVPRAFQARMFERDEVPVLYSTGADGRIVLKAGDHDTSRVLTVRIDLDDGDWSLGPEGGVSITRTFGQVSRMD